MSFDVAKIKQTMTVALSDRELSDEARRDVVFHMTDWLVDLEALYRYYSEPDSVQPAAIEELLARFLVHVPNHVAAAAKLMVDFPVSDIFQVGAVDLSYDERAALLIQLKIEIWGEFREPLNVINPSNEQIAQMLQSLDGHELCVAKISLYDDYYLLVDISDDLVERGFECRDGTQFYACMNSSPALTDVIRAFQQFASGDRSWMRDFEWVQR